MVTISVEFDEAVHSLDALNAAAYRMIGTGSCQIEKIGSQFICRLTTTNTRSDPDALRLRFIDLVTDECLREQLAAKTETVRNLILSLAFGALAADPPRRS